MTTQTEEVGVTEEDLELIKERETNIRQLEVSVVSRWSRWSVIFQLSGRLSGLHHDCHLYSE